MLRRERTSGGTRADRLGGPERSQSGGAGRPEPALAIRSGAARNAV